MLLPLLELQKDRVTVHAYPGEVLGGKVRHAYYVSLHVLCLCFCDRSVLLGMIRGDLLAGNSLSKDIDLHLTTCRCTITWWGLINQKTFSVMRILSILTGSCEFCQTLFILAGSSGITLALSHSLTRTHMY